MVAALGHVTDLVRRAVEPELIQFLSEAQILTFKVHLTSFAFPVRLDSHAGLGKVAPCRAHFHLCCTRLPPWYKCTHPTHIVYPHTVDTQITLVALCTADMRID